MLADILIGIALNLQISLVRNGILTILNLPIYEHTGWARPPSSSSPAQNFTSLLRSQFCTSTFSLASWIRVQPIPWPRTHWKLSSRLWAIFIPFNSTIFQSLLSQLSKTTLLCWDPPLCAPAWNVFPRRKPGQTNMPQPCVFPLAQRSRSYVACCLMYNSGL